MDEEATKGIRSVKDYLPWMELVQVLETQKPLKPLTWSNGLAKACQKFVNWAGPGGIVSHSGPNGKSFVDRINAEGKNIYYAGIKFEFN